MSAGNDIVSFAEINPVRTKQPAFYKKFLVDLEIARYPKLPGPEISFEVYIWLLWSVKEAAFKYLQRLSPQLIFSPTKFEVAEIVPLQTGAFTSCNFAATSVEDGRSLWQGSITVENTVLPFLSFVGAEYVHSVITITDNSGKNHWAVEKIAHTSPESQSVAVRKLCIGQLGLIKPGTEFNIVKSAHGVPSIYDVVTDAEHPVSFSHHGHFVACAFMM